MSYIVSWDEIALNDAAGFLTDDEPGLSAAFDAADSLASEPRPREALELGGTPRLRLHVGQYRLWYDIDDVAGTVTVIRCGRAAST